jgi:hypothetical protein
MYMFNQLTSRSGLAVLFVWAAVAACDVQPVEERTGAGATVLASMPTPVHAIFPAATCRPGYQQAGPRLCISNQLQNAATYPAAASNCRTNRGQVCSYEDLTYLYRNSQLDAQYNPNGRWIGNMPSDDQAFCGNAAITADGDPDGNNFEGTCAKSDNRGYWCCHDDLE